MELISDGLLLAAAMTAVFYCFAINRRLGTIRKQSAELMTKLGALDETVARVETAIAQGRDFAKTETENLKDLCARADTLRRDLRHAMGAFEQARGESADTVARTLKKEDPLTRIKRLQGTDRRRSAS